MTRPPLPEGPWLVVGLARSGLAAARVLKARGETVVGVDTGSPDVEDPGFDAVHLDDDGLHALAAGTRAIVKSPGVPPHAPVVERARAAGVPVLGELELAWRLLDGHRFVAITGTNGKTTVTEWLTHALEEAGVPAVKAGNVGTPLSDLVSTTLDRETTIVCECSSYQLHDAAHFAPEVGVLLNLGSDHLDWHRSEDAYRAAKLSMFARQRPDDVAIAPRGITVPGPARRVDLSAVDVGLPGAHNRENGGAVLAAARALGADADAVSRSLRGFGGVEHRLERVVVREGVTYVNDSKATNVASTLVALDAMDDGRVHLILGGDDAKGEDFTPLSGPVAAKTKAVYLIGAASARLHAALGGAGIPCGTLERAVEEARALATEGDVVLLSPACASFDQFTDFAERGRAFKELAG